MVDSASTQKIISQASQFLLIGMLAAVILVVVPFSDNFLYQSKSFLVLFGTLLMLGLFFAFAWMRKSFEFVLSPFTGGLVAFGVACVAATFFTQNYPVENLLGFGGSYIAIVLLALAAGTLLPRDTAKKVTSVLAISSAVLVLSQLAQLVGFGPAQLINQLLQLQIPTTLVFNLAGSPLVALEIIALTSVAMIATVLSTKFIPKLFVVTAPILVIGILLNIWAMLPGKTGPLQLPSVAASWSVALDTIRSPRAALIGSGPASYQNNYLQFKPAWVNGTENWNLPFTQAANLPLTLIATTGFFGLISWTYLNAKTISVAKTTKPDGAGMLALIAGSTLALLLVPANIAVLTIQAIAIAALVALNRDQYGYLTITPLKVNLYKRLTSVVSGEKSNNNLLFNCIIGLFIAATLYVTYLTGRAYAAHVQLFRSDLAYSKDDAVAVYELQQSSYRLNPYLDVIRRRYANTNLLIAIALANKTDASEAEKKQVGELLQQAIREARSATVLDPTDSQNWQVLAQIYQNMIGVTEDASNWTVQSYVQAIQYNPNDPGLRLGLGGVFMNAKEYQQAANIFAQAVQIKPDYAASNFQLARALVQIDQLAEAKAAYQQVLVLLPANTEEYTLVTKELEEVEKQLAEQEKAKAAAEKDAVENETPLGQQTQIDTPSITNQALDSLEKDVVDGEGTEVELNSGAQTTAPATTPTPVTE